MKVKAAILATLLGASVVVAPTPAAAATRSGCGYPYVCLYFGSTGNRPASRFRDVTGGWQWLNRSFGARAFKNTRHDDVAYILTTTGRTICVRPGQTGGLMNGGATAIRISYRSHC